jgi:membrane protease YdiL (CAAX protease family)
MEQVDMNVAEPGGEPFVLKPLPILIAILLGIGIPMISAITIYIVEHFVHLPERPEMPWIVEFYVEVAQLIYALVAINQIKRYYPGDYGLRWPEGNSYVAPAILWGLFFGVFMTFVDFWPQLVAHRPPSQPYPLTPFNITGWLSFEGVFAGASEETLFRGLLVTYLAAAMPGRVSFRGYTMNGAGVVVAALFALAHFGNFFLRPFPMALGQLVYAFALGVLYAYWFEKSRSLLAPIVGHNVSNVVEQGLIFAMVAAWGSPHAF